MPGTAGGDAERSEIHLAQVRARSPLPYPWKVSPACSTLAGVTENPTERPRRKRRWIRFALIGILLGVALLLAFAPALAAPIVRGIAIDRIAERVDGRASIQEFSLSWGGKVHLGKVSVVEASGAPIARIDRADASIDVWDALRGRYRFDLDLAGFEVVLRQRADGHWNVEEWAGAAKNGGSKAGASEPLDAQGAVKLSGGRVVVEALDGTTSIEGMELAARLEPPGAESSWRASFTATRDGRPAGSFHSEGTLGRADASFDPRSLHANGTVEVASLPLALAEPFLGSGPSPRRLRGELNAKASLTGDAERARFEGTVKASGVSLRREAGPGARALALEEPEIALDFAAALATERLDVSLEKCELRSNLARGSLRATLENLSALGESPQASAFRVRDCKGELWYRPERLDALLGTNLAASLPQAAEEHLGFEVEAALEPPGTPSTWKATLTATQGGKPAGTFRTAGTLERKSTSFDPKELAANGELAIEKFPLALAEPFLASPGTSTRLAGELDAKFTIAGNAERSRIAGDVDLRDFALQRTSAAGATTKLEEPRIAVALSADVATERLDVSLETCSIESSLVHGSLAGKLGNLRALLGQEANSAFVVENFAGDVSYRPDRIAALLGAEIPKGLAIASEERIALSLDARLEAPGKPSTWKASLTATQGGKPAGTFRTAGTLERKSTSFDPKELAANGEFAVERFPLALAEPFLASPGTTTQVAGMLDAKFTISGNAERSRIAGDVDVRDFALRRTSEAGATTELEEPRIAVALAAEVATERLDVALERCTIESGLVDGSLAGTLENLAALGEESPSAAIRARGLKGELRYRPERVDALLGTSLAASLAAAGPEAASPADEGVAFELDAALEPPGKASTWKMELGATRGGREAGTLRSEGRLERKGATFDLEDLAANGSVVVERFPLALLQPVLGAGAAAPELAGELGANLVLSGDSKHAKVTGDLTAKDLRFRRAGAPGSPPIELVEPALSASLAADVHTDRLDVELSKLALEAQILRGSMQGRFENLRALTEPVEGSKARIASAKGDFTYVPDRIAALLGPFLPVSIHGSEPKSIAFELAGDVPAPDLAAVLPALTGRVELGLGGFSTTGISGTEGNLSATLERGQARWTADADANGGKLSIQGSTMLASLFDAKKESKTTFSMKAQGVGANSRLAPLLSALHPAFAAVGALDQAEIGGLVNCELELGYDGPLAGDAVLSWKAFPKSRMQGKGSFSISGAKLQNSPLLEEMLALFHVDASKELALAPLEFQIQNGRVSYAKAWSWTIQGVPTTFTGSVGLDQTLALSWNVPITDALVEKYGFLSSLRGQKIELPIGGTVTKPKLDVKGALKDLALQAAQQGLLEGLGGLGGGGDAREESSGEKPRGGTEDPARLLADADALWKEGRKVEAAAIYERLRDEHKLSLVYLLNRDHIKKRAEYEP